MENSTYLIYKTISNNKKNIFYLISSYFLFKFYQHLKNKKNKFVEILYLIPYLNKKIKKELYANSSNLENNTNNKYNNFKHLPIKPFSNTELLNRFEDKIVETNRISGIIYTNSKYDDLVLKFYNKYFKSNPLHPDIYPDVRNMEIDIVNVSKNLYKGGSNSCGSLTSGGTESILLSCVTYRDYSKEKMNIITPNIIGFETIHPAFDKACHYFNIKLIKTKNISEMKSYINSNTICIVGSAPDYPYGLIDPIYEMNNLAMKYNVNFHIDACMGGFLLPFIDDFKYINFNLKGLTSISMDTHKYGYAPKGSSVLLFSDIKFKKYQHFVSKEWCGGVYATPTMLGSKPGGIIAGTWASLFIRGTSNFIEISNKINNNLLYIKDRINKNKYLEIIGDPKLNIIAVKSNKINIYSLINEMGNKNWNLTTMQNPPSFHFCITDNHNKKDCEQLCKDLDECSQRIFDNGDTELKGTLALYGASENLETSLFIDEIIHDYIFLLSQNNISFRHK